MSARKIINNLYEHFKNTPKRLKIVCDWDEVIQASEPYALWEATNKDALESHDWNDVRLWEAAKTFPEYFYSYWFTNSPLIEYSPYGSKNKVHKELLDRPSYEERMNRQANYKNSPYFYHLSPFLTIAEDLLKLIREGKVERLIFLSVYDKRKFPNGDPRKSEVFRETFHRFAKPIGEFLKVGEEMIVANDIHLVPFDSETQGQSKADWIKLNANDFDLVIDDNPNICKEIVENISNSTYVMNMTVCSPYYPAIKHDERVLLVKNEVSELKKEDFK